MQQKSKTNRVSESVNAVMIQQHLTELSVTSPEREGQETLSKHEPLKLFSICMHQVKH